MFIALTLKTIKRYKITSHCRLKFVLKLKETNQ